MREEVAEADDTGAIAALDHAARAARRRPTTARSTPRRSPASTIDKLDDDKKKLFYKLVGSLSLAVRQGAQPAHVVHVRHVVQARAVRGALRDGAASRTKRPSRRSARSTSKKYKPTRRQREARRLEGAARRPRRRAGPARRVLRLRLPALRGVQADDGAGRQGRGRQGRRVLHDVPAREARRLARAPRRRRSPRRQQGKFKEMHDAAVREVARARPRARDRVREVARPRHGEVRGRLQRGGAPQVDVATSRRARRPVWTPRPPCSSTTASTKAPCIPSTSRCGSTKSSR